jgi:hypothetical protein
MEAGRHRPPPKRAEGLTLGLTLRFRVNKAQKVQIMNERAKKIILWL